MLYTNIVPELYFIAEQVKCRKLNICNSNIIRSCGFELFRIR